MRVGVASGTEGGRGEGESSQAGVHQLRAVQRIVSGMLAISRVE